eukprot:gene17557-21009_t
MIALKQRWACAQELTFLSGIVTTKYIKMIMSAVLLPLTLFKHFYSKTSFFFLLWAIRKETAEDLHDGLGNKLIRIQLLTDMLLTRTSPIDQEKITLIEKIRKNTDDLYATTKDLVWMLDPENDSFEQLSNRLKNFVEDTFRETTVLVRTITSLKINGISFPLTFNKNILLIFQEAISNCIKYAGAKNVLFIIKSYENGTILFLLKDNGKGFDLNYSKKGNGLNNMHERAKRINAKLNIFSNSSDDHTLRDGYAYLINNSPSCVVVASYCSFDHAKNNLSKDRPDVILLDIQLPGTNGIDALPALKKLLPDTYVIVLTVYESEKTILHALANGANGYFTKNNPFPKIIDAIQEVTEGGGPMSINVARTVIMSFQRNQNSPLTKRETEVLILRSQGKDRSQIAEELFIETETVKTHIKNIYSKLNVNSRADSIRVARENKFI